MASIDDLVDAQDVRNKESHRMHSHGNLDQDLDYGLSFQKSGFKAMEIFSKI